MRKPFRKTLRKTLAILDGRTRRTRGQSLVELTLTFPILMFMLLGLVEVGWLANNYLTLLDASREAGRYGSVRDPRNWTNGYETTYHHMDCDYNEPDHPIPAERDYGSRHFDTFMRRDLQDSYPGPSLGFGTGIESSNGLDYYDGIACTAITNMLPLEFKDDSDDIVISVVSYALFTNDDEIHIVGRLPVGSNECTGADEPFNPAYYDSDPQGRDNGVEGRLGYFFRGNHMTSHNGGCRGSEFTTQQIENMLNRTLLDSSGAALTDEEMREIGAGGLVLVEIFWEHEQLLGIPIFSFMPSDFEIHVWSMFPNTAAEPACQPLNDFAQC